MIAGLADQPFASVHHAKPDRIPIRCLRFSRIRAALAKLIRAKTALREESPAWGCPALRSDSRQVAKPVDASNKQGLERHSAAPRSANLLALKTARPAK